MYNRISALSDKKLEKFNFPRAEVEQGLKDFEALRVGKVLF